MVDMTNGNPSKLILMFALPMILSRFYGFNINTV